MKDGAQHGSKPFGTYYLLGNIHPPPFYPFSPQEIYGLINLVCLYISITTLAI
jgi:hypothetical protein